MSAIKVNFEIGHEASLRSKKTPEGFTHDWEVFVRGHEGADLSHFVDKVVFHLHDTFPKPRRVVKEPPYSIKESGYGGFIFPIEIYLKNKDEPKKIKFTYDFTFQQSGVLKDRYVFQNPNDDFRKKLLKGGGIIVSNNAFYTNPDQESRSRDSFSDEKPQLTSKPKLSLDNTKKHKSKEHKEETPHRTTSFENLFGPPIQKPPKVSPDPKKIQSTSLSKSEKKDKERTSEKKSKHEHKENKTEKIKIKEEKDKSKIEKIKNYSKEPDKSKDKSFKRSSERHPSPENIKKRCISPVKKVPSPIPRSSSASSFKEEHKLSKHNTENVDQKKNIKNDEKLPEIKVEKEAKEKKKKEKKSHDRDKERKEKKEHKKDDHKTKESPKLMFETPKDIVKEIKSRETPKDKEIMKESPIKDRPPKSEKVINKFSIENLRKSPPAENVDRPETQKKERLEPERKHKHKKKDKKRDESKDKHKESNKEKKHKHDKNRETPVEKVEIIERRDTPIPKERPIIEPGSPISIDTASQCSSKSEIVKMSQIGTEDANSSHSESESSLLGDDEENKIKLDNPSPEPLKREPTPEAEIDLDPEPEPVIEVLPPPHKEKSKKHKDKSSKREEKKRKRKAAEEENNANNRKICKSNQDPVPTNNDTDRGESSGTTIETKVQDNGVSSSLGEDAELGDLSPEYMGQLRDLQKRIMTINNNEELERVVNLIAETGRYEVTTATFDFDLCLLDRSTVQQLIQLVGC
ncbi:hypothetical protein ACJJTC_017105 [Scirpophaga incertulas]